VFWAKIAQIENPATEGTSNEQFAINNQPLPHQFMQEFPPKTTTYFHP
jgi:hypothetical protein